MTVESFCQNTGNRGLADTPFTGKKKRMGNPSLFDSILQGPGDRLLADHLFKSLRTAFSGNYFVCH
jgi:hypothetical protein